MSVRCEGCDRTYDESRFEGGRTIWCACGRRVGVRLEPSWPRSGDAPRFIADAMLGRLARWLRLLGVDCAWDPEIADADLVRRSLEEERIVLTRDRSLPDEWWVSTIHVLPTDEWPEQLVDVMRHFGLAGETRLFSRCADCNRRLEPVSASEVSDRVPDDVTQQGLALHRCPACDRLFWDGSHTDRMRAFVERVLAEI